VNELQKAENEVSEKIRDGGDAGALHPSKRGKGRQNADKKLFWTHDKKTEEHWKINKKKRQIKSLRTM